MRVFSLLCCIGLLTSESAPGQDAIVRIYAVNARGAGQGTGFFTTSRGQVVTAYHVVEGATKIEVIHDRLGSFTDIRVDLISTDYDMAVLQILNVGTETPFMQLSNTAPAGTEEFETEGYPRGGLKQHFMARATRQGFVNSQTIRDQRGVRLFDGEIDVVSLDLTIYSGMSGAPVWGQGGVIGVLSGSFQEGGGIAWAIPSRYLQALQQVGKRPSEMGAWPRLTLMAQTWRNLRGTVRVNTGAAEKLGQYVDQIEALAQVSDQLHQQALTTLGTFISARPFLVKVANDPTLGNDAEAAQRFLNPTRLPAAEALDQMNSLMGAYGETYRQVGAALFQLMTWVTDESNIPDRQGEELTRRIRTVRDEYRDHIQGLEAYLGVSRDRLLESIAEAGQAPEGATPAQEARFVVRYLDAWRPTIEAYASVQALSYLTRDVSKFRRIAQLFEPIVYQHVGRP